MIHGGPGGREATFVLRRLADYSPDALSMELRRVAALVGGPVLTIGQFQARSRVSYNALWRHFGGWRQALERAGLGHRYSGRPVTAKMRANRGRRMSDAELLDALRAAARRKKTHVLRVRDLDAACPIGYHVVARRFGSWAGALERAGLAQHKCGLRYGDRQCFENLRDLWLHLGRPPRGEDVMRPPSRVGLRAYLRRFKTWRRALHAFVDWANADAPPAPEKSAASAAKEAAAPTPAPAPAPVKPEDRRHVPLGLRFQVLRRDRYTCLSCGDSPIKNKSCDLEVDHVRPFARGGRTVIENLRTLCKRCNLGKGARVEAKRKKKPARSRKGTRRCGRDRRSRRIDGRDRRA